MHSIQPSFPSNRLGRSSYFKTLNDTIKLPYNNVFSTFQKGQFYTYSKNYIYKPYSANGMVGTTASSYLARRRR
jgi:hypothetical protein